MLIKTIKSLQAHDLNEQDEITLSMKDGNIDAIVKKVKMSKEQQSFLKNDERIRKYSSKVR